MERRKFLKFTLATATVGMISFIKIKPIEDDIRFMTNGGEVMRLDSKGNLGLGISNPSVNLTIKSENEVRGE